MPREEPVTRATFEAVAEVEVEGLVEGVVRLFMTT
jgi:hypothetical protein